jgi:lactose/L-arabinose transport system ATP-binding protein
VFLFDEPLSNLDAELRVQMRVEISRLHKKLGATMIYVTHDQSEAMTLADRIVVLRAGNIEQIGRPLDVYGDPANQFVAGFVGSPKMNFLSGTVAERRRRSDDRPGRDNARIRKPLKGHLRTSALRSSSACGRNIFAIPARTATSKSR